MKIIDKRTPMEDVNDPKLYQWYMSDDGGLWAMDTSKDNTCVCLCNNNYNDVFTEENATELMTNNGLTPVNIEIHIVD